MRRHSTARMGDSKHVLVSIDASLATPHRTLKKEMDRRDRIATCAHEPESMLLPFLADALTNRR